MPRAGLLAVLALGWMTHTSGFAHAAGGSGEARARTEKPRAGKTTKAARAGKTTKSTRAGKATRAGRASKATKAARAGKAVKADRSARSARKAKAARKAGRHARRNRRVTRTAFVGPEPPTQATLEKTEGMPRGFSWPPSPAMLAAEQACEAKLTSAGIGWQRAEPEGRIVSPIIVPSMTFGGIQYTSQWKRSGPFKLDCQLALALVAVGPELFAIGVREVRFGSIFRWSHVRSHGQTRKILSRHGLGLAMDIWAFVDVHGNVAAVKAEYPQGSPLLLAIERVVNAHSAFRMVLTPGNDPVSHHDHYHIEARSEFTSDAR